MIICDNFRKKKLYRGLVFLALFLCTLVILHHIPLTVDDLGFQKKHFETNLDAMNHVIFYGNGRFFGNGGLIFLMHHLLLGDLIRAAVIAGLAMILTAVLKVKTPVFQMMTLFLLLSISPGIFGETYSWMSGFQNYVPPVFLFLCAVFLIQKGKRGNAFVRILRYSIIFICGISMQFYIEHSSCLNCLAALLITVQSIRKHRETLAGGVLLLISTALGLLVMFYATFFLVPVIHGDVGSYFSNGAPALLRGVLRNTILLSGMYTENAVSLGLLSALLLFFLNRAKPQMSQKKQVLLHLGLAIPSLCFFGVLFSGLSPWYGKLAFHESILLVAVFLWYTITAGFAFCQLIKANVGKEIKHAGFMFLAALVCVAPVLFVWPVGYRCLFHSSVMLFGSVLLLTKALHMELAPEFGKKRFTISTAILLAVTVIALAAVFADIRRMVSIRDEYLREAAAAGAETAEYFMIPSPYIHDYWNNKFEHVLIIEGNEIKLEILPANIWLESYYYRYS